MKKNSLLGLTLAFIFTLNSEAWAYTSMGKISRKNAWQEMSLYSSLGLKYLEQTPDMRGLEPEWVGHRAGSYEEYPTTFEEMEGVHGYLEIHELMDRSFNELTLSGIEIDIRLVELKDGPLVYVAHDQVDRPTERAQYYLRRNSLKNVLKHFVEKGYYKKGKKIFIEIKTEPKFYWGTHPEIDPREVRLIEQALIDMEDLLKNHPHKNLIKKQLGFAAFNFYALEAQAMRAPEYSTFWIATSNGALELQLLQGLGLGGLNDFMLKKVKDAHWLTGIWFDPFWIDGYPTVFNELNDSREVELELYLSTYGMTYDMFRFKLWRNSLFEKLRNFKGLIFDIKKS